MNEAEVGSNNTYEEMLRIEKDWPDFPRRQKEHGSERRASGRKLAVGNSDEELEVRGVKEAWKLWRIFFAQKIEGFEERDYAFN